MNVSAFRDVEINGHFKNRAHYAYFLTTINYLYLISLIINLDCKWLSLLLLHTPPLVSDWHRRLYSIHVHCTVGWSVEIFFDRTEQGK